MHRKGSPAQRFWEKVEKTDSCWLWTGAKQNKGYGVFWHPPRELAHRVIFQWVVGLIPMDMEVIHSCDSPPCVNPAHLRLATHAQNMADKRAKGRDPTGSEHWTVRHKERVPRGSHTHQAKLTDSDVLAIRQRYASGDNKHVLAAAFNVTHFNISHIVKRRTWTHL